MKQLLVLAAFCWALPAIANEQVAEKEQSPAEAVAAESGQCANHEYPTAVIADYVLGCMAANGNSFESLHQCSCSIDFIKERMSYTEYEEAQTIMQVQLDKGQRGIFYREASWAKNRVDLLKKYQAESTLNCF